MKGIRFGMLGVGSLALALGFGTTASAQEGDMAPNQGAISFSAGADYASTYWFRGMAQENEGFIGQPWAEVSFDLAPFGLDGTSLNAGTWNSFHENIPDEPDGNKWFESDLYVGVSQDLPGNFSGSLSFTQLNAPAGGGIFSEEISVGLSYDDSDLMGDFALSPSVTVVFETDGGSDSGAEEGTFLGVSFGPSFQVVDSETMPVTLSLPVSLGFSIEDYYETNAAGAGDDTFGYADLGVKLSTPLAFMPQEYGSWSTYVSGHVITLGDSAQTISSDNFGIVGDDDTHFYAMAGFSFSY